MVICFNFLFNLSLYCCCLAFLKTKLYLLKAKKRVVRVFGVAFVSSDEIVYLAFLGGKLLLQMGVKNYVFLD